MENSFSLEDLIELAVQLNQLTLARYEMKLDVCDKSGRGELIDVVTNKTSLKWQTPKEAAERLMGRIDALSHPNLAFDFLAKLRDGGAIVSSNDCTDSEISNAKATNRFYVDPEGFCYIWRT